MDLLRNGLRSFVSLQAVTINPDGRVFVIDQKELKSFTVLLSYCKV